jgi:hypothetical protein
LRGRPIVESEHDFMIVEHQAARIGFEPDLYSPFCADLDGASDAKRLRRAELGLQKDAGGDDA